MADGKKYDNSGIISKNKKKTQPSHPDITGSANVDGVEYWVNAWKNDRDDGSIFYRMSFKPKDQQQSRAGGSKPAVQETFQDDEDMPF
jgi:hypothetical protein